MKSKKLAVSALFLALLCLFAISARSQTDFSETLILDLKNVGAISFQPQMTALENQTATPLVNLSNLKQQVVFSEKGLQRILYDEKSGVLFGYALEIKPHAAAREQNGKNYQIVFAPLTETVARLLHDKYFSADRSGKRFNFRLLTLPTNAAPQILADGDAISLDLLVSQQLGLKITDRVRVAANRRTLEPLPARDFTLDEVELAASDSKLYFQNQTIRLGSSGRDYQGSLLWFHLPDKGLFVVSLTEREGYDFVKTGTLKGRKISFQLDGETFEWVSSKPFLPAEGMWFVWILHVPDYAPPTVALSTQPDEPETDDSAEDDSWINRHDRKSSSAGFSNNTQLKNAVNAQPQKPKFFMGAAKTLDSLIPKD